MKIREPVNNDRIGRASTIPSEIDITIRVSQGKSLPKSAKISLKDGIIKTSRNMLTAAAVKTMEQG
jgi:hypothetical protein